MEISPKPSKGLTLSLTPETVARLRQPEEQKTTIPNDDANENDNGNGNDDANLPSICIDLEQLIGYRPPPEELDSVRSQLLTAMWSRYKEQNDGHGDDEEEEESTTTDTTTVMMMMIPPPDFDAHIGELLETGVATFGSSTAAATAATSSSSSSTTNKNTEIEIEKTSTKAETTTTTTTTKAQQFLIIHYPPMLQSPKTGERISTSQVWEPIWNIPKIRKTTEDDPQNEQSNQQQQQHQLLLTLPFVQKLWEFLQQCSRNLFWKRDMSMELKRLVKDEQARLEYQEWTESKRQSKLENLYSIRETIVHQLEVTKTQLDTLEDVRENEVRQEMQQEQRRQRGGGGKNATGLESFGTSDLSFPDEFQLLGLRDEPHPDDEEEDDWGLDDDDYDNSDSHSGSGSESSSGYLSDISSSKLEKVDEDDEKEDGYDCDDDNGLEDSIVNSTLAPLNQSLVDVNTPQQELALPAPPSNDETTGSSEAALLSNETDTTTTTTTTCTTTTDETAPATSLLSTPFMRRKERREKAKRRKRQERKEAKRKAKVEALKALEDKIRVKHTTKEMVLVQTMHKVLNDKVQKVEELLETLQEEVWEAEEEDAGKDPTTEQQQPTKDPSFSLLDQVLAMILGTLPKPAGTTPQEHYTYVQSEHHAIIKEWKAYFGRLPPPAGVSSQNGESPAAPNTVTPSEQRLALGITDNDTDDWEAVEDWDDVIVDKDEGLTELPSPKVERKSKAPQPKEPTKPTLVGLRPGGSAKR